MRCPVCRAEAVTGSQCRRCRADLSLLLALEEQRQQALTAAYRSLRQGLCERARARADSAEALRNGADVRRLRALVALLQRDFAGAWRIYTALSAG